MGCLRGMSSLIFNKDEDGQVSSSLSFLKNGSMLLEELIASCNGRYNIPIRNFSAKDLLKATNNFDQHQGILDEGSYRIYKGYMEERPILVEFAGPKIMQDTPEAAIRDIVITSQMRSHKNVARFFGWCLEFECPALVYEYSGDVPLDVLLYNRDGGASSSSSGHDRDRWLSWKSRLKIAKEIANAVTYLHTALSRTVVYRDLKPSNIMVDQHGVAKLFDFSLSISIPLGESRVEDLVTGTLGFLDPEYFQSSFVTEKSDVYSFGVLLLVLLTGQRAIDCNRKGTESLAINVKILVDEDQFTKIVEPRILEEGGGGIEQEQQLRDFLALALRCIELKGEDRPEMIDVAKELRRIERYNIPILNCSARELLRATNNFDGHQIILEEGSYNIYKGSLEERPILVKKFAATAQARCEAIRDRKVTLQMSSHKNIARLFGCCMELEGPALVYEYSGDEPLNNFLYDRDTASGHEDRLLKWESRLRIAKDIADAVVCLHTALSEPIVNRDLKPSNIMVDQHGVAKLFDFSFSISIPPGESRVEDKPFGAVWFMDPDYIQSGFITDKSDVFSFGMILLTLLTGQSLFSNNLKEAEEEGDLVAYVKKYVDKNQITEILDPIILEGGGIEQEKQFRDFLELALRCVQEKGEDRPEMIYVAKELTQIERSVLRDNTVSL